MYKLRTAAAVMALTAVLASGQPVIAKGTAVDALEMPPAVVFVQDSSEKLLLRHNFEEDNGLLIPWDMDKVDKGFFVNKPDGE